MISADHSEPLGFPGANASLWSGGRSKRAKQRDFQAKQHVVQKGGGGVGRKVRIPTRKRELLRSNPPETTSKKWQPLSKQRQPSRINTSSIANRPQSDHSQP